jgi:poly(3-hydroxybutyrate) depolymerase
MKLSATSNVMLTGLFVCLSVGLAAYGCASKDNGNQFSSGAAGTTGAAGQTGAAGTSTPGDAGSGAAGTGAAGEGVAGGGVAGTGAGTAGAGPTDAGAAGAGATDSGAAGSGTSTSTGVNGTAITAVVPTMGCGMDPGQTAGQTVKYTIQTMGTKPSDCADSKCGAWSYPRDYYVTLPVGYVKTKAYPLVLEGPGCGGNGSGVYPLSPSNGNVAGDNNVGQTVIRVGLTPPPNAIGHATNPNQGCFDDKEGDSSVDWVFYENLYDDLSKTLCFDRNRVFSAGDSSGAWFSNEVGCKYAGDATRPIRGIMPNTGGLPNQPMYEPTCTNKPMAGMWVGETNDPQNAFVNNEFAISRALVVNGCTMGTTFDAVFPNAVNYPIGNGRPDNVCKLIQGCPTIYPLVVCLINGNGHNSHPDTTNPGFSKFITQFITPGPFLTQ